MRSSSKGSFWKTNKLQKCAGACIQAFGHVCKVYRKEASGRPASINNCDGAYIQAFGHTFELCPGIWVHFSSIEKCSGACIQAFGHICEVPRKEASRRKASFNNAMVLVYKRVGTYVKFTVRKLLGHQQASKMRWCLHTSVWAIKRFVKARSCSRCLYTSVWAILVDRCLCSRT